jgi:hypothetical protein
MATTSTLAEILLEVSHHDGSSQFIEKSKNLEDVLTIKKE